MYNMCVDEGTDGLYDDDVDGRNGFEGDEVGSDVGFFDAGFDECSNDGIDLAVGSNEDGCAVDVACDGGTDGLFDEETDEIDLAVDLNEDRGDDAVVVLISARDTADGEADTGLDSGLRSSGRVAVAPLPLLVIVASSKTAITDTLLIVIL